jgi:hypothetical protein
MAVIKHKSAIKLHCSRLNLRRFLGDVENPLKSRQNLNISYYEKIRCYSNGECKWRWLF